MNTTMPATITTTAMRAQMMAAHQMRGLVWWRGPKTCFGIGAEAKIGGGGGGEREREH